MGSTRPYAAARGALRLSLISLVLFASACATTGGPPGPAVPPGSIVEIRSEPSRHVDATVDSTGAAVTSDFLIGTGGGAALGGLGGMAAAVGCGPLMGLCVPLFGIAGLGVGGAMGAVAGTTNGAVRGLPADKASALNAAVAAYLESRPLEVIGLEAFEEAAGRRWRSAAVPGSPAEPVVRLTVAVTNFGFEQLPRDTVQIAMTLAVTVSHADRERTVELERRGAVRHIDEWLAEDGIQVGRELEAVSAELAAQVAFVLSRGS